LVSYFHSVSVFPRKSRKVSAPLSSLDHNMYHVFDPTVSSDYEVF
jgi:hypothetical protein